MFSNDNLNEMANAACVNNQRNPRGSINLLLTINDPILQNEIVQKVMQQNGNPNNNKNQFNKIQLTFLILPSNC